jgi:hypothetical protein
MAVSLSGEETLASARLGYRRFCFGAQVGPRAADVYVRVTGAIVECESA